MSVRELTFEELLMVAGGTEGNGGDQGGTGSMGGMGGSGVGGSDNSGGYGFGVAQDAGTYYGTSVATEESLSMIAASSTGKGQVKGGIIGVLIDRGLDIAIDVAGRVFGSNPPGPHNTTPSLEQPGVEMGVHGMGNAPVDGYGVSGTANMGTSAYGSGQ